MKKLIYSIFAALLSIGCSESPNNISQKNSTPEIYPDYVGVTIPASIAPLNFSMAADDCEYMDVTISNSKGESIHVNSEYAQFDMSDWKKLLSTSKGDSLSVSVCSKENGYWFQYKPFCIYVSPDNIDGYGLTYRRLSPAYNIFSKFMGIYCRSLSTFDEKLVVSNELNKSMCINCHVQNQTRTGDMVFHIRGGKPGTYIRHNGKEEIIDTKVDSLISACVYDYWHPSGKYIAFSNNGTKQSFHVGGMKRIEVYDEGSNIVMYDVENHTIIRQPELMTDSLYETYPVFSPDGKWLYFSSCRKPENEDLSKYWYDIKRIPFDETSGRVCGKIETIVDASSKEKNAVFPRISPDGQFLMYSVSDYSSFTIWHKESDLWIMNLSTKDSRPIVEVNSDEADSFHNWSADSRWYVFTSRRDDGLHSRLYIGHVDKNGKCSKAFLLPQENPKKYYRELFESYNTPDFCDKEVDIDHRWLLSNLKKGGRKLSLK